MSESLWGHVIQGGALAVLAMVLWYGLHWVLPTLHREFVEAIKSNQEVLRHQQRILARLTVAILQHDAQVRGVNPETLGTTSELIERVLRTNGE